MYATFQHNTTKDKILLHTTISQGNIQALYAKTKTDSKVLDDLKENFKYFIMTGNINTLQNIYDDYIL